HGLGGGGEEVAAAIPVLGLLRVHQTQVGLMNQRRRLQRLPGLLLGQPLRRQPAQLVVNQWQELLGGVRVALVDRGQDARDFGHQQHQKGECLSRTSSPNPLSGVRTLCISDASYSLTRQFLSAIKRVIDEYTSRLATN